MSAKKSSFSIVALSISLFLLLLVLSLLLYSIYINDAENNAFTKTLSKTERLKASILHYDETLTMSALMYASTGKPIWEERYNAFVLALAKKTAPDASKAI
jgi:CHASE1-domain containing sensor protein